MLQIVHHPDYDARFPASHRFPMGKYTALMKALRDRELTSEGSLHEPAPAPLDTLALAHHAHYVDQVINNCVPPEIEREIGFAVDERVSRRASLATAGTLLAARLALKCGIACNTAGGSHHARRAHGTGFCTFNDVGVAASALLGEGMGRILVVDLDVHQGDGTADIFAREPRVFTFSMHGANNYPARKIASDLDIGLPDGTGDAGYLAALAEALPRLLDAGLPEIVFYNAGIDPHGEDRLGRMTLSDDGLRRRDRMVIEFFRARSIPVCGVIGGGYSRDIASLGKRHAILFETASDFA
ncbi:histone deacetylase [Nitratireductor luteus]|uniref:histone deacetylase family protein n=1 Tax=Nitratireductor luteus TaxID=2976980 RepID=UPI00224025F9|nr:histone deacetylase [Nitratireductor luteus]